MKPDASDLMELGRDLFQYLTHLDRSMSVDERRQKVIAAMAHLTPNGLDGAGAQLRRHRD